MNLNELYYFPSIKVNAKIADILDEGHHIEIDGYRYERLQKKPRGRSISRTLLNEANNERIVIYS